MYLRWRRILPDWLEVVPVELPGRGGRLSEALVEDFDSLVVRLCEEQAEALQGDFALFGHSMGALLAYGMTRRLLDLQAPAPFALLASGSPAPSRRKADHFPGKGDKDGLLADLRKQGGTPEEVFDNAELIGITLDVLGSDYRVCESFRYAGPEALPMPVHVFGGRSDSISEERLRAWSEESGQRFTVDWFEGGHFFIRQSEGQLLARLTHRLSETVEGMHDAAHVIE